MSEDGSDASPKRKKKQKLRVVSESESEEESGAVPKRKHLRVVSDDESSGSSVPDGRRTRTLPQLQDYNDSDSEWESDNSDEPDVVQSKPTACASDSSEGNSDKCPICLLRFSDQAVGIPESCEHMFCVDCITEWSRNVNTCPVDRMTFTSIVVRTCAGGRVLQTRPVGTPKLNVFEDTFEVEVTRCQVCDSPENEATMLLCDECDQGFHMQCLTPPMDEIPDDEWFCSNCEPRRIDRSSSNAFIERIHLHLGRPSEAVRRRSRNQTQPSTSAGTSTRGSSTRGTRRKAPKRRTTRRRVRTVVTEYEIQDGNKFPIKKKVPMKRRVKKRKAKKRAPRTAARRTLVRASVRERLAALRSQMSQLEGTGEGVQQLAVTRHRAGIPGLSLFGDRHQLDYFSEDERDDSGGGGTFAVALRPSASVLSAYRQARRKMISIPSPPHASSAPDLLSNIIESQTLLHSKNSLVSVTVDGKVNIKLQSSGKNPIKENFNKKEEKVDLSAGEDSTRKAPSYPGHSRGGGWNGGYRGGYRGGDQGNNNNVGNYGSNNGNSYGSGNSYRGNYRGGGGGYNQGNQGNSYQPYQNSGTWQDDSDQDYRERRPHQYDDEEEDMYNNRPNVRIPPPGNVQGRGPGYVRSASDQGRSSLAPSWQQQQPQYSPDAQPRQEQHRHSFGGFEQGMDALDMRVGPSSMPINETGDAPDLYGDIESPRVPTPPQHYEPLPEPPVFRFMPPGDVDKSEDEKSDSGLVIDTEKYDPTEPTLDESSGDEQGPSHRNINQSFPPEPPPDLPFGSLMPFEQIPPKPIDSSPLRVPSMLLDKAVQQVLNEHRSLIGASPVNRSIVDYKSDEESEGDCPNFSIYSATSVNIANSSESILAGASRPPEREYLENEEDLVQEDDDIPMPEEPSSVSEEIVDFKKPETVVEEKEALSAKEKAARDEYEERLSRKCPITPNKRNPIKIKLHNTPTLIKRHVLDLYAEEDEEEEESTDIKKDATTSKPEKAIHKDDSPNDKVSNESPNQRQPSESESSIVIDSLKSVERDTVEESGVGSSDKDNIDPEKNEAAREEQEEIKSKTSSDNEDYAKDESCSSEKQAYDHSEHPDDITDDELRDDKTPDRKRDGSPDNATDALEKMTESISESEDERSYTPCLDENKSKDTSFENEKENVGIEGLDTEMISEDEGNEMFSDAEDQGQESEREGSPVSPPKEFVPGEEEGEIVEKLKELESKESNEEGEKEEGKKKKRKERKVTSKDKSKSKGKKSDITFKKLSKSGKERNYRDKEDKGKIKSKDRKKSDDKESRERAREKRKEKRKDMERYDVRNIVSEKRRRVKDAFGRDSSRPRSKSPSNPPSLSSAPLRSLSRGRRSISLPGLRRTLSRSRSLLRGRIASKSKDRYTPSLGRKSPRRSMSRGRTSLTPIRRPISPRLRSSISPRGKSPLSPLRQRSISPMIRRSISPRLRRSISPRIQRSISPQMRRSISPRIRRSISPRMRVSISPRIRVSISPRIRRSISPRLRRSISPRLRRSMSPRRRSISPRAQTSVSHRKRKSASPRVRRKGRRSVSPRKRTTSPRHRVSPVRGRKRARSRSPKPRKSKSPRKKARPARSRLGSPGRNRSRTPKPKKSRRTKARKSRSPKRKSPKPKKRVSRSITPELMLSPAMMRERLPPVWRNDKAMYQEWSDSRSIHSRMMSPSWTPPREPSPEPRHLRVYLTNKDKAKRKEKKKRQRESDKIKQLRRAPDIGPSKEVFTSGNNILVSVSFNKDELAENQAHPSGIDLGTKKRKRKTDPNKKERRERLRKRRERKNNTENKKPVAIIDLEKSPFRELTPSPKNVIVLSDSDHAEKEEEVNQRQQLLRNELREAPPVQQEVVNPPSHREPPFLNSVGPKTPPEPSVKFSIVPKANTQLRVMNPLQEEDEPEENQEEAENQEGEQRESTHKGPNTPPDPPNTPPSSPDAYDPFEPTKSGSATPEPDPAQNGEENVVPQEKATITLETAQKTNLSADDVVNQRPITPIEKVMALLQSTRNVSPTNVTDDISIEQPADPESGLANVATTNGGQSPDRASTGTAKSGPPQSHFSLSVAPTVSSSAPIYHSTGIPRIGAFTNAPSPRANAAIQLTLNQRIVLPSPTKSSPLKTQPAKLFLAKPSPIKSTPIKPMPSKTIISKLPLPSVKPIPGRKKNNRAVDIIDLDMDMDSPYSPGSSDFGDLFEPPADTNSKSYSKSTGKTDIFDSLFGQKSKKGKSSATKVPVKQIKKKGKTQVGVKIDEDSLKILDDLPSSAVEMQVKSKFLKKLNRQERVVEEVKLVLKPHYNKKHVTKEQYKDILRRAVPKICHNKTGEINPAKIQALVEAYVRKHRKRNKLTL